MRALVLAIDRPGVTILHLIAVRKWPLVSLVWAHEQTTFAPLARSLRHPHRHADEPARFHRQQRRRPVDPRRSGRFAVDPAVDRRWLYPGARGWLADRWSVGRHVRPPTHAADWRRRLHGGLGRLRGGDVAVAADRGARAARRVRRADDPAELRVDARPVR